MKGVGSVGLRTGVDIIEVDRIRFNIEKYGSKFLNRVFTEKEIEYCELKNVQKYESYAGRFAAKEAVFKAISEFLENKYEIEWKQIEIVNNKDGRPIVNINLKNLNVNVNNVNIDVSISHIKSVAIASVVLEV